MTQEQQIKQITRRSQDVYVESLGITLNVRERDADDTLDMAAFLKGQQLEHLKSPEDMAGPAMIYRFQVITDAIKHNRRPFHIWAPWTWKNRSFNRKLGWRYLKNHLSFGETDQLHLVIADVEADDDGQPEMNGKKKAPPISTNQESQSVEAGPDP